MFETVLKMSLYGGIAAALVLLARLIPGLRPNVKFLLWCLVFLRLALPPGLLVIPSAVSLQTVVPERTVAAAIPARTAQGGAQGGAVTQPPEENARPQTPETAPAALQGKAAFDWMELLEDIWLAGMATTVLLLLFFYIRMLRRETYETAVKGVYTSDHASSPVVVGVLRPKIVLPVAVDPMGAEHVLLHERTHIRRGDHITKPLFLLVAAVHWFNPLAWLAYFLAVRDMEMAVDEAVLRASGGEKRKQYAAELLNAAQSRSFVFPGFGESDVKRRIKGILSFKKPSRWIAAASVLLVAAASVFLLAGGREETSAPNALVPSVMVEDVLYYMSEGQALSVEFDETDILGRVVSTVPITQWPTENGQANIPCLDAPYARYENGVALFMDGKWVYFAPRDARLPADGSASAAQPSPAPAYMTLGADNIMAPYTMELPADCVGGAGLYLSVYYRNGYFAGYADVISYYADLSYRENLMNNHSGQIGDWEEAELSFTNGGTWAAGIEKVVIGRFNSDDHDDIHSGRTYDHITYNLILAEVKSSMNEYLGEEQTYQNCIQLDFATTYYEADGTPVTVFTEEEIRAAVQSFAIKNDKLYEPAISFSEMYRMAEQAIVDALYAGAAPEARAMYEAMGGPDPIKSLMWSASTAAEGGRRVLMLWYDAGGIEARARVDMDTGKMLGITWGSAAADTITIGADDIIAAFTMELPSDCTASVGIYDAVYWRNDYHAGYISVLAYYADTPYSQLMGNHSEQTGDWEEAELSFTNGGTWAAGVEKVVIGRFNSDDYNDVHSGRTYDHITYNLILAEVKSFMNEYLGEEQTYQNCIQLDFTTTYYEADGTPVTVFTEEEIRAAVQSFAIKNDKLYEPAISFNEMYRMAEQAIVDALYAGAAPEARKMYAAMGKPETIEYLSWTAHMAAEGGKRVLTLGYAEGGVEAIVRIDMDTGEMLGLAWGAVAVLADQ